MDGVSQGGTCPTQTVDVYEVHFRQEELLCHAFAALQHLLAGSRDCLSCLLGSLHHKNTLDLRRKRAALGQTTVDSNSVANRFTLHPMAGSRGPVLRVKLNSDGSSVMVKYPDSCTDAYRRSLSLGHHNLKGGVPRKLRTVHAFHAVQVSTLTATPVEKPGRSAQYSQDHQTPWEALSRCGLPVW